MKIDTVISGLVNVETVTSAGYSKRVAKKSTWQLLAHEIEAGLVELALGAELMLGVIVCRTVVGTLSVVVTKIDEITVETMVDAGIWLVMICVDPD